MSAEIVELSAHEVAELDTQTITMLRRSLGDQRCREILDQVMFHLADRLGMLHLALGEMDRGEVRHQAGRLAGLSEQIGLSDFARVARDLIACLDADEPIALAAVATRLERLGEVSLSAVMSYAEHAAL